MKIQKKQKTWIEESIEKMGEKPEDFACEDIECEEKKREQAEKKMNKRLEPAKKVAEKTKEEDHVEEGKPLKEEKENITSYDVKDRKELASLLEELHLTTKDVSIKRSVKEGCRYQVTLKSVLNETKEVKADESLKESKGLAVKDVKPGQSFKPLKDLFYCDIEEEGMFEDDEELVKEFTDNGFKLEGTSLIIPAGTIIKFAVSQSVDSYEIGDYTFDVGEWSKEAENTPVEIISINESKFSYVTDPNGLEGEVEANNKEEATKKVETELAQKGVAVSDEIIDVEEKKINESKSNYEIEKEISKIRTYKELCNYVDSHPGLFLNSNGRFNLTVKREDEDGIEEVICDVSKFYRPFQKEVNKADLRVVKEEKEIDDGPEHGYESVKDYERAQAILDEMSALRKEEEEKGKAILKAWAIDKTMSDEEFHKQSEELHNSTQEKVEKLYKELIALPVKKESFEQDKEKAISDAKAEAERLKYAPLEDREKGKIFVVGDHVKYVNNDGWTAGGEENIGRTGTIISSGRIGNLEIFTVFADDERYYKGYENFTFNATADNLEFTKEVNELKESIDKEALEFYVNNWEEGDNITITADLLNVLEQALEMTKKYSKEECLHEDIDASHPLVGKKVTWKEEETTIDGVEDEEDSVLFKLGNGKMIDPRIALGKTLKSEDEEVLAFIDAHKEKEPEEVKKDDEPKISEYDRGCEKAREDFKNRDKARYKKLKKNWDVEAHDDFDKGYMDTYSKLEKSAIANKQRGLKDITINNTYKGDVDELIDWLKNGGISSINVISNEDDFDRTKDFIDELNKRDNTSYALKTTNKQGDSYEITLTTNKDILEKMPEEVKTWVALKNSGKFGSTAEKVPANVYSEKDHTLTSNGIVIDLLTNYDFHLGDYKEKKESLEESVSSDKKKLKYLLAKEEVCPLDRDELWELQELINKYGYPEDLEESKEGFVTFLNLELGVLWDDSDEFEYYSSAYDHKHGYYDETYLNGLEKDFDHLKEVGLDYVKRGVANTYAILTSIDVQGSEEDFEDVIQQIEEDGFIDESVDFLNGEQFDVDNVIWSAYKDENGDIHENFVGKEEVKEELKESTQKEELDEGAYPLSKKVGESVKNWWEDVIVWNQEHDYIFNIANDDDYEDIEGWHAAMFDMLDDIKKQLEKEDDEELKALFKKGKRIYNNNALSQYREEVEQKEETPINEVLDDEEIEDDIDDDFLSGEEDLVDAEDVDDDFGVGDMSYEEKIDFLAGDEQEAIDGYDEVIDTVEDEHVKDQLEHIRDEEIAHKEFLDAVKEDPKADYEDFEHKEEEVIDNTPEEEFVDPEDVDDDMQVVIIDEK